MGPSISENQATSDQVRESEQRDVAFALRYWDELRGENDFPAHDDVDPSQLRDLWPFVFIVSLGENPEDSFITFGGAEIAKFCGHDPTGRSAEECFPSPVWERMKHLFDAVVKQRRPLGASDNFTMRDGREVIYRSVVMPLSDGGEEIKSLLGVIKFKIDSLI